MPRPSSRSRRVLAPLLTLLALLATVLTAASPAQAAVPNRFGFVLWNGAAVVPTGTTPAATTVVPIGVGRYQVKFPGQAAIGGVVHVTAINTAPHSCQVEAFGVSGADEIVNVRCFKVGGVLDNSGFSAIFSQSSGVSGFGPFGYVDTQASGAIVGQYNASGAANTVTPLAVGQWLVRFPGIGSAGPVDGSVQATPVGTVNARCKVANWNSLAAEQRVWVYCFTPAGAPMNTRFTLTYQQKVSLYGPSWPPKYFGYLWFKPPVGPATTNFNSVGGFGVNTVAGSGAGLFLVTFPNIAFTPDTVQVTAFGTTPDFCGLNTTWAHIGTSTVVRDVNCFTVNGTPVTSGFTVSANSLL
ncbi:hypothetical protein Cs7R123_20210 [Catellatospora sp. TT07R-123]|uniref:hypothetical protein n=1 Tax=Catellatospora sp. TT07R-123 TaxID=2733863 RepID=UPI001B0316D6|nr:hypothetical protein [Catellatospora sp. TT07R-123]GHJ44679.1 hypothetical protein Cs7R123_20210 [Catellatospora sp. TT07R-123]